MHNATKEGYTQVLNKFSDWSQDEINQFLAFRAPIEDDVNEADDSDENE